MSTADKSRYAAAGFIVLLILSVLWPAPVVSINRLWLHRPLPIDELSFLGREAPSWDAIFWCMAGLFAIAVVNSGEPATAELRSLRGLRLSVPRRFAIALIGMAVFVALIWIFADTAIVALAERVQ